VLLFETNYPRWLTIIMGIAAASTFQSVSSSVLCAYAIERLRFKGAQHAGLAIYLAYLVPPSILFIPLATLIYQFGLFDNPVALILTYPTFLVPFCTWLLIGYLKSIPYELEECALIDGASRLQILRRITLPQWGALMAGSLLGSVPAALIDSFFVEYYVSSMTGAVKE
jgi:multiple sugar transport system permease protein